MLPLNKAASHGCTPTSSNCVIWDGPSIPCADICEGQNLTQAMYHLAKKLCDSASGLVDVESLQLKCLVEGFQTKPDSLAKLLQLLIDKVCSLDELVEEVQEGGGSGTPGTGTVLMLRLPQCLQYLDSEGDEVLSLSHSEFSKRLAAKLCEILTEIGEINSRHTALVKRVSKIERTLQESGIGEDLMVRLVCLREPGEIEVEKAILLIEEIVCELKDSVGPRLDVLAAISKQCLDLRDAFQLSLPTSKMQDISGWIDEPTTIADTITNIWLTICDTRAAIIGLRNLLVATCDDVLIDFVFTPNANGENGVLKLFGLSVIPTNWSALQTSHIQISDGTIEVDILVDVMPMVRSETITQFIGLKNRNFNLTRPLTFRLTVDLIDEEGNPCRKIVEQEITPVCTPLPARNLVLTPGYGKIDVTWSKPEFGTPDSYLVQLHNNDGEIVVVPGPATPTEPTASAVLQEISVKGTDPLKAIFQEIMHTTGQVLRVEVIAVYGCGNASAVSAITSLLVPIKNIVRATFSNTATEIGSVAYLRVNGEQIPVRTQFSVPVEITSGPDGVFTIDYAVSAADLILHEMGMLRVDTIPSGTVVRVRDQVYEHTVVLNQLPANSTHDVVFNVFTDANQDDIDDNI